LIAFVSSFVLFGFLSNQFLTPVIHTWKSGREVERSLSEITAFQQIAKYDPQVYRRIKTELVDSIRKGESQEQAVGRARQAVGALVMRYIPHASNEAIVHYVRAMAVEIEELAEKNPEACYQFSVSPGMAQPMSPNTLKLRHETDLAALAEVIRQRRAATTVPNAETGDALLRT
jgi:hypothetical protein